MTSYPSKTAALPDASPPAPGAALWWRAGVALVLALYAAGLLRELSVPWIGMHDWNGAYYSQLARNFLRYPWEIHHGLPLVAVGPSTPPPEERSIYATHPPALVWILATAFQTFGERESVARLTAIAASLLALAIWLSQTRNSDGAGTALLAGLVYGALPMSVFFGRMVNHEPYILLLLLAAVSAYPRLLDARAAQRERFVHGAAWAAAVVAAIWIDWPGALFAGLSTLHVVYAWRRGRTDLAAAIVVAAVGVAATAGVCFYLVYGGLEGHWPSLWAIFRSRSGQLTQPIRAGPWTHTLENFTLPVLVFAAVGIVQTIRTAPAHRAGQHDARATTARSILLLTALAWLAIFWRQYCIHAYWAFYLGPFAALWAARGILAFYHATTRIGRSVAVALAAASLATVLFAGAIESRVYFSRRDWPTIEKDIAAWKGLKQTVGPDERLVLPPSYLHVDQYGRYRFRNITPPQIAYYLDRRFVVGPPPAAGQAQEPP